MTAKTIGANTTLRDVEKCNGDIANQNGTLRCTALNREKR